MRSKRLPPAPAPASVAVSAAMRGNRSKDTRPELAVRRVLFKMGYRYRLHRPGLPGRPDIALPGRRKVVFVHGCFWHQHPSKDCPLRTSPKSNRRYWTAKLSLNQRRDRIVMQQLAKAGWKALIVWECQIDDTSALARRLETFLRSRMLCLRRKRKRVQ